MNADFVIKTLCRGDGKGYVLIRSAVPAVSLRASAEAEGRVTVPCQLYPLSMPGEDYAAAVRANGGDPAADELPYVFVVVLPLLDGADLFVNVYDIGTGKAAFSFTFKPLETKIRSRLTYRFHDQDAYRIRDIEHRHSSGRPTVNVTGIYPVTPEKVSWRIHVSFPYEEDERPYSLKACDASGNHIPLEPMVLEDCVIPDRRDSNSLLHDITYAVIMDAAIDMLCIWAEQSVCEGDAADYREGNFDEVLPFRYHQLVNHALDETKNVMHDQGYGSWLDYHRSTDADVKRQRALCSGWELRPLISILVVLYETPEEYLHALLDSVLAQSYPHFELILVNAGDSTGSIKSVLSKYDDARIKSIAVVNRSIAENTNAGLDVASGDYVAFVDHDDVIEPDALYRYVAQINADPQTDLMYCDEDQLIDGEYRNPVFKPQYNADMLLSSNYICHMLMVSRHALRQVELSPADVSGAQDYDLTLKVAEVARSIHAIPYVLYHWRVHQNSTSVNPGSKPYAEGAGLRALDRHFRRTGITAKVHESELPFRYRTEYVHDKPVKVSIVIPTKDHTDLLGRCLESVFASLDANDDTSLTYDVTLVENNSTERRTFDFYERIQREHEQVHVVTWPGQGFNYSAICNYGASHSDGDLILFLNNDTQVMNDDWLRSMSGFFARPEVGIVGAKMVYSDGLVQHGGVWVARDHVGYVGNMLSMNDGGYLETLRYPMDCAAVTGACQMIRRSVFDQIGGFDESLEVTLNDVDLCLKAGQAGYLTVFNPQAMLHHNEHASRGRDELDPVKARRSIEEYSRFFLKWNHNIKSGKYINRNLDPLDGHYKLVYS
ncbi:glycosyltransferase family 2 protein [Bifidobacterium sp. SO4]|uniref:glycosyltransferase family 2 protein n=1 Tax=Bifidobacterium sp. SO4 TaxID=2809030 RepID=UPI001BDD865E|nr:glycosyltransferase family 2 protein [Bifidobacterium sp. SO4]MBT1170599.1 glycosyltransferase family 2 protein [Bifidobacterium sp. SO4]